MGFLTFSFLEENGNIYVKMNLKAIFENLFHFIFESGQMIFFKKELNEPEIILPKVELKNVYLDLEIVKGHQSLRPLIYLKEKEIKKRFARGDICFLAKINDEYAHYSWLRFKEGEITEINRKINLGNGAGIIYNCHTYAKFRGRNIYPYILSKILMFLKEQEYKTAYIYTKGNNYPSIRGIEKTGFKEYGFVNYRRFFGVIKSYYQGSEEFLQIMRRKKICLIIDDLGCGGTGHQLFELIRGLLRFNLFELKLYYLREVEPSFKIDMPECVKLKYIKQNGKIDVSTLINLYKEFREEKPELIHTFLFTADCYGRIAAILAGVDEIVCSVRNVDLWKKKSHILVDRILARFTTRFIANAQAVKRFLVEVERIDPEKIAVIYNGLDLTRFDIAKAKHELKHSLGIPLNKRIVTMIARFRPQKDYFTFLKAASILKDKVENIHFLIVGDEDSEKDNIKNRILNLGLNDYITVLLERSDIPEILFTTDISVLTSHYEGCSNAILESMAAAKPVVATDVGGNRELIADGKSGFVVELKNPAMVADKIAYLLTHPEEARQMGEMGRRTIEEKFSVDRMIDETVRIYSELLE